MNLAVVLRVGASGVLQTAATIALTLGLAWRAWLAPPALMN